MKKETIIIFLIALCISACHSDFLELKRNKKQVVPTRISDFQAIMDNSATFNGRAPYALAHMGSDEFYLTESYWKSLSNPIVKNSYIWAEEIYEGTAGDDWNNGYLRILSSNLALEGLKRLEPTAKERMDWSRAKGTALFSRGYAFFCVAQLFAKQYDPSTADNDLGIPLRLTPDPTLKVKRATIEKTYQQIIDDLKGASDLLPIGGVLKYQPSKSVANSLLARVYLQMGKFDLASEFASSVIESGAELFDYNLINGSKRYPFPTKGLENSEVLYIDGMASPVSLNFSLVDTTLFSEYELGDLRKDLFWEKTSGGHTFRGSYSGGSSVFTGIALNEMYLIRAECNARIGKLEAAMADLNMLRKKRFRKSAYEPIDKSIAKDELISLIINERKKELVFRGLRWPDLKRLNSYNGNTKTLVRSFENTKHELIPFSVNYVWPIPFDAIDIGGLQQNPRQ